MQCSNRPSSQELSKKVKESEKAHLPNSTGWVKTVRMKKNTPTYIDIDHLVLESLDPESCSPGGATGDR